MSVDLTNFRSKDYTEWDELLLMRENALAEMANELAAMATHMGRLSREVNGSRFPELGPELELAVALGQLKRQAEAELARQVSKA